VLHAGPDRLPSHVCAAPQTRQEVTLEMSTKKGPAHVVVDGSNIATEGRSMPSLAQLSEAVASFMEEHPDAAITVVVDATFGHRIDKSEVAEFEAGISNNELVAPPAGAVGRGDAFVLGIADKADASVLSNDSFQEFHGEYTWLFDEGRLIGGKPVPHVGWVWVDRVPVRGPVSRKATRGSGGGSRRSSGGRSRRGSKGDEASVRTGSKEASAPMPTPKSPPPGRARAGKESESSSKRSSKRATTPSSEESSPVARSAPKGGDPVNDLMPFLDFVEHHPVGTSVNGTVDAYSSHGAYITIGDTEVRGYVPLSLMAKPTPRSAKSVMKVGESVTVVVVSFAPARRSIDCALPDMADAAIAEAVTDDVAVAAAAAESAEKTPPPKKTAAATKKTPAKKAAAKKRPAKRTPAKKSPAKKAATKKSATTKSATKKTAAKKSAAKKSVATKSTAKKTAGTKSATKKTETEQAATKATSTRKSPAKKSAAKKSAAKKSRAKKSPAKKSAAKKKATSTAANEPVAQGPTEQASES